MRHERPAVLDQLALDGVRRVVRRPGSRPVGGVEGLDADGAHVHDADGSIVSSTLTLS